MIRPNNCSKCGRPLDNEGSPPWKCLLGHETWDNPLPVAVCVQPVREGDRLGLAVAKRAIAPALGTWCMLGGHVDNTGETIEEAAIREFREESGLDPGELIGITGSFTNGRGHVLIAVQFKSIDMAYWRTAKLCPENSAMAVMWSKDNGGEPLGFPIHRTIAEDWFFHGQLDAP